MNNKRMEDKDRRFFTASNETKTIYPYHNNKKNIKIIVLPHTLKVKIGAGEAQRLLLLLSKVETNISASSTYYTVY